MKLKIILSALILFPAFLLPQEKLNNLQTPSSPASGILGLQPSSVLTPKSYQALETSIFSNFINDNRPVTPNDFALEFTPYWAKNHGLSLEDYLFPKSKLDQFIRNSSFSLASTQKFQLGDSSSTNALAFGYRTTFYFGNKNDREEIQRKQSDYDKAKTIYSRISSKAYELIDNKSTIKNKTDFLLEIRKTVFKELRVFESQKESERLANNIILASDTLPELDDSNRNNFVELFREIIDKTTRGDLLFNEYESYIKDRQGLAIDVAYANVLNFPTNDFGLCFVPRQSIWITPTYRLKNNLDFLKIMAVFRYEWYNQHYYNRFFPAIKTYKENIDIGLAASVQFEKYSFQVELAGRNSYSEISAGRDNYGNELFRKENNTDFQYIGSFNYNLTDQIIISYSLGNRFEPALNPENTLVSTLSLNFGFGAPTKNTIK